MSVSSGNLLGTEICRIMGINPDHVSALYLECKPQAAATLTVHLFIDARESEELLSAVRKYHLNLADHHTQEAQ